jgi:hypothetical protein
MKQFDERVIAVAKDLGFFLAGKPDEKVKFVLDKMRSNLNVKLAGLLPETFVDLLVGAIALHRLETNTASHRSPRMLQ